MPLLQRMTVPLAFALLLIGTPTLRAETTVRLMRWEEPAVLLPHHGPGVAYYTLIARAEWERGDSALVGYNLQVALPGGQVETRSIPVQEVSARRLTVPVPSASIRSVRPEQVVVRVSVVDAVTGAAVSNVLTATIQDFPHPRPAGSAVDPGPFGWGRPLAGPPGQSRRLPRPGPDGFHFVRVPESDGVPGFNLATTEASNAQVARRLPGYDPKAGRSDEFTLEDPAQPALGLTPAKAVAYLAGLGTADPSGVAYRLPTRAEWLLAARVGKATPFWWGEEATYPSGANLLGPEPALATDSTAPIPPEEDGTIGFEPNPWAFFHTFGNVEEWATAPDGSFIRLGGHFRTEPAAPLPEVAVEGEGTTGPDPYVGVRPAFDLTSEQGAALIRKAIQGDASLRDISVAYDPDRATATLTGTLTASTLRRAVDRRLSSFWFLAAVENKIVTPSIAPGQLATLGAVAGPVRRITPLGRWVYEVPVAVRWGDPLPVRGSEWWVNIYPGGGGSGHFAHKLIENGPSDAGRLIVLIDRGKMLAAGQPVDGPVAVALSLGAEAPSPTDPSVVSNVVPLRWSAP